jgi:hypothetical protein
MTFSVTWKALSDNGNDAIAGEILGIFSREERVPLGQLERVNQLDEIVVANHWVEPGPKTVSKEIAALQTEINEMVDEDQTVRKTTPISWIRRITPKWCASTKNMDGPPSRWSARKRPTTIGCSCSIRGWNFRKKSCPPCYAQSRPEKARGWIMPISMTA